jgi:hypothetical protein
MISIRTIIVFTFFLHFFRVGRSESTVIQNIFKTKDISLQDVQPWCYCPTNCTAECSNDKQPNSVIELCYPCEELSVTRHCESDCESSCICSDYSGSGSGGDDTSMCDCGIYINTNECSCEKVDVFLNCLSKAHDTVQNIICWSDEYIYSQCQKMAFSCSNLNIDCNAINRWDYSTCSKSSSSGNFVIAYLLGGLGSVISIFIALYLCCNKEKKNIEGYSNQEGYNNQEPGYTRYRTFN